MLMYHSARLDLKIRFPCGDSYDFVTGEICGWMILLRVPNINASFHILGSSLPYGWWEKNEYDFNPRIISSNTQIHSLSIFWYGGIKDKEQEEIYEDFEEEPPTKKYEISGTKWEIEKPAIGIAKTTLEFQNNNQIEFSHYYKSGGCEVNHMYEYYFDSQDNNWKMRYQIENEVYYKFLNESEKKKYEERRYTGIAPVITISKNRLTITYPMGKKEDYLRIY